MKSSLRIFTYHHIPNNGAFLFAYSLVKHLRESIAGSDIKVVDYRTPRLAFYEYMKRFRLFPRDPLFYYKRSQLWEKCLQSRLELDHSFPIPGGEKRIQRFYGDTVDALMVGMDVWCVVQGTQRPPFPNIYWLPEKLTIPKLAYGVSGYYSDPALIKIQGQKITTCLDDFDVIGARDRFTHEMILEYRKRVDGLVERIPDPTFLVDIPPTGLEPRLAALGVDPGRPLLGFMLYGNSQFSQEICSHYRSRGYQVVAMSMYNPYADVNLGNVLDPFEWAQLFSRLSFCILDRFHGTVYCLKNQIPFLALESEAIPREQSKIYDLLTDFNLTDCYLRMDDEGMTPAKIHGRVLEIEESWKGALQPSILPVIDGMKEHGRDFTRKMKELLGW